MYRSDVEQLVEAVEEHFSNERTFAPVDAGLMFSALSTVKYHLQAMPKSVFSVVKDQATIQAVIHLATLAKPLAEDDMGVDSALTSLDIE